MKCALRRCQGRQGCMCPRNPPKGFYGKSSADGQENTSSILATKPTPAVKPVVKLSKSGTLKSISSDKLKDPPCKSHGKLSEVQDTKSQIGENIDLLKTPVLLSTHPSAGNRQEIVSEAENKNTNAEILVRYNHYKNKFQITNGKTTSEAIDAEYCISFAFPNSKIHLSEYGPSDFSFEDNGLTERPLVAEDPVGCYNGLIPEGVYWVHVEEDQKEKDAYIKRQEVFAQEQAIKRAERETKETSLAGQIIVEKRESCSCIEGNPCLDRYCCKDWNNRFEVAKKNGWKGFS
eukprot:gene16442-34310_t